MRSFRVTQYFCTINKKKKLANKICPDCETSKKINKPKKSNNIRLIVDNVKKNTQRRCIVCTKVKGKKAFRITFAPTGSIRHTCRKCEESFGLYRDDDKRLPEGFMYILFDSSFPELIKIGCTTDEQVRLYYYNKDKPTDTCSYVYMSKLFPNVFETEKIILNNIQIYAQPVKGKKEWFPVMHRNKLIEEIKIAEANINNHTEVNFIGY